MSYKIVTNVILRFTLAPVSPFEKKKNRHYNYKSISLNWWVYQRIIAIPEITILVLAIPTRVL